MSAEVNATLLAEIIRYDPDTGKLFWKERGSHLFEDGYRSAKGNAANWNSQYAGREDFTAKDGHGYLISRIFNKAYKAHRVILCMQNGFWPECSDHIDGNRTNNRLSNLRSVSIAENNRNLALRKTSTSGMHGVFWDKQRAKWRVEVCGKMEGRFESLEEAKIASTIAHKNKDFHQNHGR